MKLRNKKNGYIGDFIFEVIKDRINLYTRCTTSDNENDGAWVYNSLAEFNEEWEDASEAKEDGLDNIITLVEAYSNNDSERYPKEIVEKLKAWKLLEDMGFKIEGIRYRNYKNYIEWSISQNTRDDHFTSEAFNEALHFLFGGEE